RLRPRSSTTSPKPPAPRRIAAARSASLTSRGLTQSRRASATPAAAAASGSRASAGSTQAMVSPARVAAAAMAHASPVRPVLGAPASSVTRPRGSPPPSASSRTARPVDSRATRSGRVEPRRMSPGRPSRSRRAAADMGLYSLFLRFHVKGVVSLSEAAPELLDGHADDLPDSRPPQPRQRALDAARPGGLVPAPPRRRARHRAAQPALRARRRRRVRHHRRGPAARGAEPRRAPRRDALLRPARRGSRDRPRRGPPRRQSLAHRSPGRLSPRPGARRAVHAALVEGGSLMARIAGVPPARAGLLVRFACRFATRMFGKVPEPLTVAAHHPWIFRGYTGYEFALGRARRVEPRLKALAGLKAAALVGCPF